MSSGYRDALAAKSAVLERGAKAAFDPMISFALDLERRTILVPPHSGPGHLGLLRCQSAGAMPNVVLRDGPGHAPGSLGESSGGLIDRSVWATWRGGMVAMSGSPGGLRAQACREIRGLIANRR